MGLRSDAKTSAPTLKPSRGIDPPPANGSTIIGLHVAALARALCAAAVSARLDARYSATVELSQSAKSAMKSRSAWRSSTRSSKAVWFVRAGAKRFLLSSLSKDCRSWVVQARISFFAASMKAAGHRGSAGSGQSEAQMTARHAANGRRAHQMCSVDICPCRMDFSRRA